MAERKLTVQIVGDSSNLEAALGRANNKLKQFSGSTASSGKVVTDAERRLAAATASETKAVVAATAAEHDLIRVRSRRSTSVGPLRLAGIGVGAGTAIFAATQALGQLAGALKVSGEEAGTLSGRLKNTGSAILTGNVVGAFKALNFETNEFTTAELLVIARSPQVVAVLKDIGGAADLLKSQIQALEGLAQVPQFLQTALSRSQAGAGGSTLDVLNKQLADNKRREAAIRKLAKLPGNDVKAVNIALDGIFQQRKAITDAIASLNKKDKVGVGPREQKLLLAQQRAGLGPALSNDLATAKAIAAFRKEQFDRAGPKKRFETEQAFIAAEKDVLSIEKQISDAVAAQSKRKAAAAKAAFAAAKAEAKAARDTLLATLDLAVTRATLTKSLQDDLAASKARETSLRRLVALNKNDLDVANQLVSATQARRDVEQQIAENKRIAKNAAAFKALGLTAEGDKITPSSGALLHRAKGLQETLKGTIFDTKKTRSQLTAIVTWLKANLKGASKEVRAAILSMLNDISNAADKGDKTGPLTKTHGLRTAQIIKNLGLTVEQAEEIQRRLAHVTTGVSGHATSGLGAGRPARTASSTGKDGRIFVESHTTINLDGQQIASAVTRQQQKAKRRNPKQKRGPNRR